MEQLDQSLNEFGCLSGLFHDLEIKGLVTDGQYPFEINVSIDGERKSNICDVGYEVSQILPLLFEILHSDDEAIILLQQPEVHLHPRAQAEFGSLLARLSKLGKKFIVETHSDFILDRLTFEISKNNYSQHDIALLFFDRSGSHSNIHPIELNSKGTPDVVPDSYRKFFLEEVQRVWR